jgi:hypothetical protein
VLRDYSASQARFHPVRDWMGILDEYDVRYLALDLRSDGDLVSLVRARPDWAVDFEDEQAVLFVRAEAG